MPPFPGRDPSTLPRIQHIPADHPYVRHLQPVDHRNALHIALPDPGPPTEPGRWSPSAALDPAWVADRSGAVDVFHLHFGYEHLSAVRVTDWAASVHRAGVGLVVTVHDIDNPHLRDQRPHHAALGAALSVADGVVTLTPGAAAEVQRRWGRSATVIGHPHVLPLDLVGTRAVPRTTVRPRIGVALGSLRANVIFSPVLRLLGGIDGAEVTVRVSRQLFDPGFARRGADEAGVLRDALRVGEQQGRWRVDVVDPGLPDADVWRWLSSLDALVLPYAWGTHSAWAEACADVGTSVIAPDLGFWGEQQPQLTVPGWQEGTDADLERVMARLQDPGDPAGGGRTPVPATFRRAQRRRVHEAHLDVYRRADARRSAGQTEN